MVITSIYKYIAPWHTKLCFHVQTGHFTAMSLPLALHMLTRLLDWALWHSLDDIIWGGDILYLLIFLQVRTHTFIIYAHISINPFPNTIVIWTYVWNTYILWSIIGCRFFMRKIQKLYFIKESSIPSSLIWQIISYNWKGKVQWSI